MQNTTSLEELSVSRSLRDAQQVPGIFPSCDQLLRDNGMIGEQGLRTDPAMPFQEVLMARQHGLGQRAALRHIILRLCKCEINQHDILSRQCLLCRPRPPQAPLPAYTAC